MRKNKKQKTLESIKYKKFKLNKLEIRGTKTFNDLSFIYYCGEFIGHIDLNNLAPFILHTDTLEMNRITFLIEKSAKEEWGLLKHGYCGIVSLTLKGSSQKRRIDFYELDLENYLIDRKILIEKIKNYDSKSKQFKEASFV